MGIVRLPVSCVGVCNVQFVEQTSGPPQSLCSDDPIAVENMDELCSPLRRGSVGPLH